MYNGKEVTIKMLTNIKKLTNNIVNCSKAKQLMAKSWIKMVDIGKIHHPTSGADPRALQPGQLPGLRAASSMYMGHWGLGLARRFIAQHSRAQARPAAATSPTPAGSSLPNPHPQIPTSALP